MPYALFLDGPRQYQVQIVSELLDEFQIIGDDGQPEEASYQRLDSRKASSVGFYGQEEYDETERRQALIDWILESNTRILELQRELATSRLRNVATRLSESEQKKQQMIRAMENIPKVPAKPPAPAPPAPMKPRLVKGMCPNCGEEVCDCADRRRHEDDPQS